MSSGDAGCPRLGAVDRIVGSVLQQTLAWISTDQKSPNTIDRELPD